MISQTSLAQSLAYNKAKNPCLDLDCERIDSLRSQRTTEGVFDERTFLLYTNRWISLTRVGRKRESSLRNQQRRPLGQPDGRRHYAVTRPAEVAILRGVKLVFFYTKFHFASNHEAARENDHDVQSSSAVRHTFTGKLYVAGPAA